MVEGQPAQEEPRADVETSRPLLTVTVTRIDGSVFEPDEGCNELDKAGKSDGLILRGSWLGMRRSGSLTALWKSISHRMRCEYVLMKPVQERYRSQSVA